MEKICLIVDDEPGIRTYFKAVLQEEEYRTLEAENASQAFRLIQKLSGDVNLVVSDVRMPGDMSGVGLAYAIRNAFPAVPVILISGYTGDEFVMRDFELIPKPFTPETILAAVRKATGFGESKTNLAIE